MPPAVKEEDDLNLTPSSFVATALIRAAVAADGSDSEQQKSLLGSVPESSAEQKM